MITVTSCIKKKREREKTLSVNLAVLAGPKLNPCLTHRLCIAELFAKKVQISAVETVKAVLEDPTCESGVWSANN